MAAIDNLIDEIERSYEELNAQLADPGVLGDRGRYADIARKHAELQQVYELARRFREAEQTVADAEVLLGDDSSDAEMRDFAQEELGEGRRRLEELSEEIRVRMLTRDPNDAKDVIIEIRAGTGGDEASLFAGDLARMYTRYAQAKGFEVDILSANENDNGGYKEVTLEVKGRGAFSALKYESGVHRVQRVPATEAAGRIHTSAATVAVLPEAEEIEIEIHAGDRSGRGVDASRGLGGRDALHAVHPALVLEGREGAPALDLERDFLVAAVVVLVGAQDVDLEALRLRVARVHARQVAGEQRRLVAAGAGADLDDHVLGVVGVAREHAYADLFAELLEPAAALAELLLREVAHLGVGGVVAEEDFGVGHGLLGFAEAARQFVDLLQLGVLAGDVGVAPAVAEHLGVGELRVELLVGALDLVDEVVDGGHAKSLRHDLHAFHRRAVLGLELDDLLERGDGHLDLGAVGLLGGHPLQRETGRHGGAHEDAVLVAAGELDDLVADAGDEGHQDDAAEDEPVPRRPADKGEHEDRHQQHDEQERRAAAQVQGAVVLDVLDGELVPMFEHMDAHVLGAVVLEDAAQVLDLGDDGEIEEEDAHAHAAFDRPEHVARPDPVLEQPGEEQRRHEEEADGEGEGDDERAADLLAAELLLLLADGLVGRHGEGTHPDHQRLDERYDAADDRRLEDRIALHPAHQRELVDADGVVGAAHGERPVVHAAHHDALDDGLAADLGAARPQGGHVHQPERVVRESRDHAEDRRDRRAAGG